MVSNLNANCKIVCNRKTLCATAKEDIYMGLKERPCQTERCSKEIARKRKSGMEIDRYSFNLSTEKVKLFSPYVVIYDKYVPNKKGGMEVERRKISAETKEAAIRIMKRDVYRNGVANAFAIAKLANGEIISFRVYREPKKVAESENGGSYRVISNTRYKACSNFGVFD